jgi:hypothetical protein
LVPKVLLVLLA